MTPKTIEECMKQAQTGGSGGDGRKIHNVKGCECGKTYWCKDGCKMTENKQWKKWHYQGGVKVYY